MEIAVMDDVEAGSGRTRDLVARLILERGPQSAATLAQTLRLSPAAVRRHLDALLVDGLLVEGRRGPQHGRGRPARTYALTDQGRSAFPHAYDDLASTALRYLRDTGGVAAVTAFAEHRAATLETALQAALPPAGELPGRVEELATALTVQGYAAGIQATSNGTQLCQHHCPVAHVAAEFPQLCEAETRAFERVLGTYVQRLATIAHGDGVCTTNVPQARPVPSVPSVPSATRENRP